MNLNIILEAPLFTENDEIFGKFNTIGLGLAGDLKRFFQPIF